MDVHCVSEGGTRGEQPRVRGVLPSGGEVGHINPQGFWTDVQKDLLPDSLQTVLEASATDTGLLLFPPVGGFILMAGVSGQLMTRLGYYKPFSVVGAAIAAVGYYFLSTMDVNTTFLWASVFMFATGSGLGLTMPTLEVAVQNAVGEMIWVS